MNKIIYFSIILIAIFGFTFTDTPGQAKTTSIFRTCPGITTPRQSKVEVDILGNINLNPCLGKLIKINGATLTTAGGSAFILNGLNSLTQTFATATADAPGIVSAGSLHTFSFPIAGVSGTSRATFLPYYTGQNTLGKLPVTYDNVNNVIQFFPNSLNYPDQFTIDENNGNISFAFGLTNTHTTSFSAGQATIDSIAGTIGNLLGTSNGTLFSYDDGTQTQLLAANNGTTINNLKIPFSTPASSGAACSQTQIKVDPNFLYVCTSTNVWKRAALTGF